MAKDGSADTAVIVSKVIPKEHYFTYKVINLFTVNSTDYMTVANVFKKTILAYNAKMLIYDANGVKEDQNLSSAPICFPFTSGVRNILPC